MGLRVEPAPAGSGVSYRVGVERGLVSAAFQAPLSTAADFRHLTPMVLLEALARAGTRVHEPVDQVEVEAPPDTMGAVLARLADIGGVPAETTVAGGVARLVGTAPAGRVHELRRQLSALTRRARTDGNPLHREEYLRHLAGGF